MKIKAQIILGDQFWEIEREHSFADETHSARSYCLVCPICLTVWARHKIENDCEFLWPYAQFCEHCTPLPDRLRPVPGSLLIQHGLDTIDDSLLDALPPDLLMREFLLTLKAYDDGSLELRDFSTPRN